MDQNRSKMSTADSTLQITSMGSCSELSNFQSEEKRLICVVCSSIARGYNFGAITCVSCKVFFRRNALSRFDKLICHEGGNCKITPQTRRYCTYCRILTCFRVGMRKELIRKNKDKYLNKSKIEMNERLAITNPGFIRTLDLLQWSDRSRLSNNDWFVLRQLSSIFDSLTYQVISKTYEIHHQLSSIGIQPLKLRVKASCIYDMANTFAENALEFIKSIPQFIELPLLHKQALLIRNTRSMITFYSNYQMNLAPVQCLVQMPYWIAALDCICSPSTRRIHDEIKSYIDHVSLTDPYLIKLILVILAFSANHIDYNQMTFTRQMDEYHHTFLLDQIQNFYVQLMWKYMLYRFGEYYTILRLSDIINVILRVQLAVFAMDNSAISFERKFYENIVKSINKTLRFNNNIE